MFTIPNTADAFDPQQAEPDKVDIDILVAALSGRGVLSGCAVAAATNHAVQVAAGVVIIAGVAVAIAGGSPLVPEAGTNPRFDIVLANSDGSVSVEAGAGDPEPVFPAVPSTSVALAAVFVPAESDEVLDDHIVDKRAFVPAIVNLQNDGLRLLDTDASHRLTLKPGSNLTAARALTLTTGDADRTLTLSGNPTLGDWFDQSVKAADSPTFGGLTLNGNVTLGANVSMTRTGTLATGTQNALTLTTSLTGDSGGNTDMRSFLINSNTAGGNNIVNAVSQVVIQDHEGTGTVTDMAANQTVFRVNNSGGVTRGYLMYGSVALTGSGNVATMNGYIVAAPTLSGSGTITTFYGQRVMNIGNAGITNAVGFKVDNFTNSSVMRAAELSLSSGTGKHNLYIDGNANNYINGPVGFGTSSPTISGTGFIDMVADTMRMRNSRTPASAAASGNAGEICWDSNYIYVCTATNTWKRSPLSTW